MLPSASDDDDKDKNGDDDDDDDDDGSNNSEECLQEMLGGITFKGEWKDDDEQTIHSAPKLTPGLVDPSTLQRQKRSVSNNNNNKKKTTKDESNGHVSLSDDQIEDSLVFQYACRYTSNHNPEQPPLKVVDFGNEGKGKGLIASRFIPKGEVIYTERAIVASQLPQTGTRILACQHCFRSLESWTKLMPKKADNREQKEESLCRFPFPELWPVLPLDFSETDKNFDQETSHTGDDKTTTREDLHGRIQCCSCNALFCSQACYSKKLHQFGSCCLETKLLKDLPTLLLDDDEDEDYGEHTTRINVQAPVVLAAVLFLQLAHHFRTNDQPLEAHWFQRACGIAEDLQRLELGKRCIDQQNQQVRYTLQPLYEYMVGLLSLEDDEQIPLSLELLHSLASKAARNGFGLRTQSPFKPYYTGLLRKANYGGRESAKHSEHMQKLAAALGKDRLYRGMDREIESLVAPEIIALFPLTTYCNHSCSPNAQVRSQEFVDGHIDVVAMKDIAIGNEVCISYIGLGDLRWGWRSKFQRQKELQGRYLFHCECDRCMNEEDYRTAPTL